MHFDLRRTLLASAALALALGTSTVLIGVIPASGSTGPNGPTVNCSVGTVSAPVVVTFPPPGLSKNGSENTSKTDTTTTNGGSLNCGATGGSGTLPVFNIVSKATKCKGPGDPDSVCTAKGEYAYDSTGSFASAGTAGILKSLKKMTLSVSGGTIGATTFFIKNTSANEIVASVPCAANEVGFQINGVIKKPKSPLNYKGGTSTLVACLLQDTGPGTTGNFLTDLAAGTSTIATVDLDSADSTVTFTS